jgi:hypothetical protein
VASKSDRKPRRFAQNNPIVKHHRRRVASVPSVFRITAFKPLPVAQFHRYHAPVYPLQTTDNGQRNTRWQSNESAQAIEKQTIIVLQPRS